MQVFNVAYSVVPSLTTASADIPQRTRAARSETRRNERTAHWTVRETSVASASLLRHSASVSRVGLLRGTRKIGGEACGRAGKLGAGERDALLNSDAPPRRSLGG